jgi:hypothetical protein
MYTCSISNIDAAEEDLIDDLRAIDDDGLGSLPLGWSRVTIEKRVMNPMWEKIKQAKDMLYQTNMMQAKMRAEQAQQTVTPEQMAEVELLIKLQIEAQFSSLEANTEQFMVFTETVTISPIEHSESVAADFFQARDLLGFPTED